MKKLQLFISYSHNDDGSRKELDKWLINLRDAGLINEWYDGNLIAGDPITKNISQKMNDADIILLMLSQDYLASQSCKEEMNYALSLCQKKQIVSIVLKVCTWQDTSCKDLLALPKDGKPISDWPNGEEAWHNIYEGIKRIVEELQHRFDIRDEFIKELQQVEFVTQKKSGTTLKDIFVFPNLSAVKDAFKREPVGFDYFLEKKKRSILVRGREFSGKTALLRWLFMNLKDNCSPIFLDGNNIHKSLNFEAHFRREFSKQMNGDFEAWMKLGNKVAIIDNYDHNISGKLVAFLDENFAMTIVAIDDEEYMLYFMDDPSFADYSVLALGQCNLVQQEELIRKWMRMNQQASSLDELNDLEIDKLEARVDNAITTSRIVPRYPFYILSILQSFESFMPSDYQITAYGHCYQALVTAQLVKKNIRLRT